MFEHNLRKNYHSHLQFGSVYATGEGYASPQAGGSACGRRKGIINVELLAITWCHERPRTALDLVARWPCTVWRVGHERRVIRLMPTYTCWLSGLTQLVTVNAVLQPMAIRPASQAQCLEADRANRRFGNISIRLL